MFEAHTVSSEHKDVIHDIEYDFYGKRMATCSSDQYVKIWDLDDQGDWQVSASWKAHSGSVWKVTWAHPEFGQVIATCSFDRTAAVWEEAVCDNASTGDRVNRRWIRRTNLVDSRTSSVTDVKFAPKMQGLLLATCSADGIIRIYEAPDVMNLSQWTLPHEITAKLPLSCLSWNPSMFRLHPPMLAAGSDDVSPSSGGKVFIYEYSENSRRWSRSETLSSITDPVHDIAFAPNLGKSYHMLAIASKDLKIVTMKPLQDPNTTGQGGLARLEIQTVAQFSDHFCTVWRVCWNCTGTTLASSGDDGFVRIWRTKNMKAWKCAAVLRGDGKQTGIDVPLPVIPSLSSSTLSNSSHPTTRYYKLGTISHANQVPWH